MAQNVLGRGSCRDYGNPAAMRGKHSQDVVLGSEIDSDDMMAWITLLAVTALAIPCSLPPFVGLPAGDLLGEVHPFETRPIEGLCLESSDIDSALRMVCDGSV